MLRMLSASLVVVGLFSLPVAAQDTALVSPVPPTADLVYSPCKTVSETPEIADVQSGICVTAARSYLDAIVGLPATEADQAVADAVAAIAPLAIEDAECNTFDDEIAAAIRVLATRSSDPTQQGQLAEIAQTVQDCADGTTAAIGEVEASPA
jgi:hypothetical protein